MATGISPPPPFLETPGTPAIPWHHWFRLFQNFVLASGANEWPATRRRALLLHCLGPEGQRIFNALPAPPPSQPPLSTEATVSESTEKHTSAHTAAASPPDPYDVAVDTLAHYFTATVNVRVERHHFRERRQLSGKELRCLHTVVQQTSASGTSTLPATSSDAQGRIPPQGAIVEQPQSEPKFGMPALLWARFSHLFTPGLGLVRGFQHKVSEVSSVSNIFLYDFGMLSLGSSQAIPYYSKNHAEVN
ncbi:hypothetical protein MRX96_031552 [Rhipicephalus microplus]